MQTSMAGPSDRGVALFGVQVHQVQWLDGDRERECSLIMDNAGFELKAFKSLFKASWDEVVDIECGGPESMQKRITATRLVMIGPLALAARKKTGEAFAFIELVDGRSVVVKFPKKSEPQVRAIFAPYRSSFAGGAANPVFSDPSQEPASPVAQAVSVDPLDRLQKLVALRDAGALTEDEFRDQKAKILAG